MSVSPSDPRPYPPRGRVFRELESPRLSAKLLERYRRQSGRDPYEAVAFALLLLLDLHNLVDNLSGNNAGIPSTDARTIGPIFQLWRKIPEARLYLEIWGKEIINARRLQPYCWGERQYVSATHAVLAVAEQVLEQLWRVAWEANPPPGPPYAAADLPFCRSEPGLPPFVVDWWYKALPILRSECRDLGNFWRLGKAWELDGSLTTCWDVGIEQETNAVREQWKARTANALAAEGQRELKAERGAGAGTNAATVATPHIPARRRTRPLGLTEAARLMGYGGDRKAAEQLRRAMDHGAVRYERLTRQSFVFDRNDFPRESQSKLGPTV